MCALFGPEILQAVSVKGLSPPMPAVPVDSAA